MNNHFKASLLFTHGKMEVSGTAIFVLASIADLQKRDGWQTTTSDAALNSPTIINDIESREKAIDDVELGDVVAEMHGHETNYGILKGWDVVNRFETTHEMASAIAKALPLDPEASNKIIGNKYARVFGIVRNDDDLIVAVQVIYLYDTVYHCATLVRPQE